MEQVMLVDPKGKDVMVISRDEADIITGLDIHKGWTTRRLTTAERKIYEVAA